MTILTSDFFGEAEIVTAMLNKEIVVTPLISTSQINSTIDLRLGTEFIVKRMDGLTHFDPVEFRTMWEEDPEQITRYYERIKRVLKPDAKRPDVPIRPFILHPGQFALGCTLEYVRLAPSIGAFLEGVSSWAREALNVHSTAGIIHPGHDGIITFELHNLGTNPITLYAGTKVAQLLLYRASIGEPYMNRGKYRRNVSTSIGRPWEDWEYKAIADALKSSRRET